MRWWLALATVSLVSAFGLTTSSVLMPREPLGVSFGFRDDVIVLRIVNAGSNADRLRLSRANDIRVLTTTIPVRAPLSWEIEPSLGLSLVLGLVLAWRRFEDRPALLGAWLLPSIGSVLAPVPSRGLRSGRSVTLGRPLIPPESRLLSLDFFSL